jgi:uncharacterized membrane protein YidH (DUF202 family)
MKLMLVLGVILMLIGGGLMVKGYVTVEDKHSAKIFGQELSVTEKDKKPIPPILSGTLLVVGAALTVAAAVTGATGGR